MVLKLCHAFFPFFFVVHVNGAFLMDTLFCEELVPVTSFIKTAGAGYRFPVEPPTSNFSLKRWARVAFSRFNTATRVNYPAEFFFLQSNLLQNRKTDDRGI
jgi:hypothetical protein